MPKVFDKWVGKEVEIWPPKCNFNVVAEREFQYRGKWYRIEVYPYHNGDLVWVGYRADGARWKQVPAFTRAEENRYPKFLAEAGYALWKGTGMPSKEGERVVPV
jgi:hypothetical protein